MRFPPIALFFCCLTSATPAQIAVPQLIAPAAGAYWQVGKSPLIQWENLQAERVVLEYSIDSGAHWMPIDTVPARPTSYRWKVPATPSVNCLLRVRADSIIAQNQGIFCISADTGTCRIVVLGSSTAAGIGPSAPDSAWVNRYSTAVFQKNTRFEVVNLALGGITTYHILPTGTKLPRKLTFGIDTSRNITRALALQPAAIIVNMPSNDAAHRFTLHEQVRNFKRLSAAAQSAGVPLWVCTTQPRNFPDPVQRRQLIEARDSLQKRFGDRCIDFWSGLADANGNILPAWNSGDGVHLNDAAHRLLCARVSAKMMEGLDCAPQSTTHPNPPAQKNNLVLPVENR